MAAVRLTRTASVSDQLAQVHDRIAERAYARYLEHGDGVDDPLGDWLAAERELVWSPALALRERDGAFVVDVALPGLEARDIALDVTPDTLVLTTDVAASVEDDPGTVHYCDLAAGAAFRTLTWPRPIDAARTRAEYRNGMLRVIAPIAPSAPPPTRRPPGSAA